jgi:hypothetical protein
MPESYWLDEKVSVIRQFLFCFITICVYEHNEKQQKQSHRLRNLYRQSLQSRAWFC